MLRLRRESVSSKSWCILLFALLVPQTNDDYHTNPPQQGKELDGGSGENEQDGSDTNKV